VVPRVKELRYRTRILPDADPTMHPEEKKTMQCPTCGGQMTIYRIVPGVVPYPELQTFKCDQCSAVITVVKEEPKRD